MGYLLQKSSTAQPLVFLLISSTDHLSPVTGLGSSVTVTLSKNGGSFNVPAGAITEIANGWYQVAGNATDTGTLGPLLLHATGAGSDPCDDRFDVVAFNPLDAAAMGLTNLDATVGSRLASTSYVAPPSAVANALAVAASIEGLVVSGMLAPDATGYLWPKGTDGNNNPTFSSVAPGASEVAPYTTLAANAGATTYTLAYNPANRPRNTWWPASPAPI